MANLSADETKTLKTIIHDSDGAEAMVRYADDLGKRLKNSQAQWGMGGENRQRARRRLVLLKPKMAYRARREPGRAVEELVSVLDPAVDLVVAESDSETQDGHFQRFVEFFEAILAYHRAHGGS
jgi:CRISPR-associated protein Csm2